MTAGETSKLAFLAKPVEVVEVMVLREQEAKERIWVRSIGTCSLIEELQRRATESRTRRRWRMILKRASIKTNDINLSDFIFGKLSENEPAEHSSASGVTRAGAHDAAPTGPSTSPSWAKEEVGLEKTKSNSASEAQ